MTANALTARDIIADERRVRAERGLSVPRYAVNPDESSIAAWSESMGRWIVIAGQLIGKGEWCAMKHELLVNGVPLSQTIEWTEVAA
jgi:hypothetical protein